MTITALGTAEGLEVRLVPEHGYPLRTIPRVPMPRRPDAALLRFPGALSAEIGAAAAVLRDVDADVVAGFGGYVSTAAYLGGPAAAAAVRRPRGQHPARPGQPARRAVHAVRRNDLRRHPAAARVCAPACRCAARSAPSTGAAPGGPARAAFGLDPDRPTLLVTGGSPRAPSG